MENEKAYLFKTEDLHGNPVSLEEYRGSKVLLTFFRYASCPFCNLRLQELMYHYPDWKQKGAHVITLFESPKESMLKYSGQRKAPFPVIADPDREIYEHYGVVNSSKLGVMKGLTLGMPRMLKAMSKGFKPGATEGDPFLMPADFLIGPDLQIELAYYGNDIGDHLPFKEVNRWLNQ